MKFYVAVDCEGIACTVGRAGGSLNDSPDYGFARLQATREADAAAKGLFAAGATQVIVWDNHNGGVNLDYDRLDPRCDIALGVFSTRFPGLDDSFDGLAMIGYHARDNTPDAVMCHTYSSVSYQHVKINGREVGEIAIDAALAGSRGVPLFFLSSDDKAVAEALELWPDLATHVTKQALGWNAALSKHPLRSCHDIESEIQAAAKAAKARQPFTLPGPLRIETRYKRLEAAEAACRKRPDVERIDAYTVARVVERLEEAF